MDSREFGKVVAYLEAAYPASKMSPESAEVYYQHLRRFPLDVLRRAAMKCVDTLDWFPTIAQLRAACNGDADYRTTRKELRDAWERDQIGQLRSEARIAAPPTNGKPPTYLDISGIGRPPADYYRD